MKSFKYHVKKEADQIKQLLQRVDALQSSNYLICGFGTKVSKEFIFKAKDSSIAGEVRDILKQEFYSSKRNDDLSLQWGVNPVFNQFKLILAKSPLAPADSISSPAYTLKIIEKTTDYHSK